MNKMLTCREGTVAPITGPILRKATDPLFYTHSQGRVLWPSKEALLSYAAAFDDTVNIMICSPVPSESLNIGHFRAAFGLDNNSASQPATSGGNEIGTWSNQGFANDKIGKTLKVWEFYEQQGDKSNNMHQIADQPLVCLGLYFYFFNE